MTRRVAVIYPFVPHYRRPVFSELSKSAALFRYIFFADEVASDTSIRSERSGDGFEMRVAPVWDWRGLVWQRGLFRVALDSEFDVLIFLGNPYYVSTWIYALLGRFAGKKVFFWTHGWLSKDPFLKRVVRNCFYKIPDGLLLYGDRAKSMGVQCGFSCKDLHVIYNSLDYSAQKAVRYSIEKLDDPRSCLPEALRYLPMFVACIARLTPQCRFELAIDALAIFREESGLELPLVLIGDGPIRIGLGKYASDKGVEVVFLGELYGESEIGPVLYNARMVISPGKVGLTAMHGLAYGTPVVTHNDFDHQGPEFEAIVDGVNGSFFSPEDAMDLSRRIAYWVKKERTLAERKLCYEIVEEKYTPVRQVQLIEAAIEQSV